MVMLLNDRRSVCKGRLDFATRWTSRIYGMRPGNSSVQHAREHRAAAVHRNTDILRAVNAILKAVMAAARENAVLGKKRALRGSVLRSGATVYNHGRTVHIFNRDEYFR